MKKTLLFTENFPPIDGGSGRWFWELYSRLPQQKVIVVAHNVEGGSEFDTQHSIPIVRIPLQSPEWGLKSLTGLKFYWRSFHTLRKLVKQHKVQEIHCGRVIHEGVTAWLLKLFTGTPYRCFVHGEDVETAATSREQALLVKQVCKHATSLICNSYNSSRLVNQLGFAEHNKCNVLHPGVDITKFVPAEKNASFRDKLGWGQDKLVLLTVGRLQRRKGQDFMLKAMPELLKQMPNLHYAVVGRGECEAELRECIQELQLQNSVTLHTNLNDDELIQAYQQCDVFILPNRTIHNDIEGFGMVLVEAQACGIPVIAGDSGGTAETLVQGETGYVIDCSDSASISAELPKVITQCLNFKSGHIRAYAAQRFNWEKHTNEFTHLIQ